MSTTIRRDYDPERDCVEETLAEHEASREEERKAWARLVNAHDTPAEAAGAEEVRVALAGLRTIGVDVGRYLAPGDPNDE